MKIEVLYFDGCPNHRPAVELVREVLREQRLAANIVEVNIRDQSAAQARCFLGSPTIRINGLDVEPSARLSKDYGMMCRTYIDGMQRSGAPSKEMIRAALRETLGVAPSRSLRSCSH